MSIMNITEARANFYKLIDEVTHSNKPVTITGKRGNAVLISESDWNAICETLHLASIPNMVDSIKEGMKTDLSDCTEDLGW